MEVVPTCSSWPAASDRAIVGVKEFGSHSTIEAQGPTSSDRRFQESRPYHAARRLDEKLQAA